MVWSTAGRLMNLIHKKSTDLVQKQRRRAKCCKPSLSTDEDILALIFQANPGTQPVLDKR